MKKRNKLCILFLIIVFSINFLPSSVYANTTNTISKYKTIEIRKKTVNENSNIKNCDCNSYKFLNVNNQAETEVVNTLVNAYKNSATSVDLSKYKISINDIEELINKSYNADLIIYNCRQINGYSYSYGNNNLVSQVYFSYGTSAQEFNKEYSSLSKVTSTILNSINSSMTDLEKALYVHDYIIKNTSYDYDNLQNNTLPEASYTAYGVLVNHIGVCSGYANAYKLLMDMLGIKCIIVSSSSMNHAWNMIELNNSWYHIDSTWDDPVPDIKGHIYHKYFLINDSEISQDHYGWQSNDTPVSNSTNFSTWKLHNVTNEINYVNNYWYYLLDGNIYKSNIDNSNSTIIKKINSNSLSYYNNKLYYTDNTYSLDSNNNSKYNLSIKSCDLNGNNETTFYSLSNDDTYSNIINIVSTSISTNGVLTATLYDTSYKYSEITKTIINTNESNDNDNGDDKDTTINNIPPSILYKTHVQHIGWQDYVKDGASSGTTGKSLRLEGIQIKLDSPSESGSIKYRTHIQKIGWQNYVNNDELSGTTGRSLRLEAIQIELTGDISNDYDIYYRVHAQHFGWLDWAKNNEMAGTSGYGYRLEAIEIQLVPKGSTAPGNTNNCYHKK